MALTGRYDFRRKWTGKIVLLVEEEVKALWPLSGERPLKKRWRDATLMDLTAPELRTLMDARTKPHLLYPRIEVERTDAPSAANVVPLQSSAGDRAIVVPKGKAPTSPTAQALS